MLSVEIVGLMNDGLVERFKPFNEFDVLRLFFRNFVTPFGYVSSLFY